MRHARWTAAALPLLAIGILGMTQPNAERSSRQGERPERTGMPAPDQQDGRGRLELEVKLNPETLRIRLQRMIERGQEMSERAQSAIDKLDAGASASEVLNELRPQDASTSGEANGRPERGMNKRPDEPRDAGPNGQRPNPMGDHEEIHAFLRSEFPELWENLEPIITQDPRNAERLLGRMAPQIREILALKRSHPELASTKTIQMRAGLDFVEAARVYRTILSNPDASDEQIAKALLDMRTHAETRFDAELRAKQLEIAKLEEQLDQLRFSVDALEERRAYEVDRIVTAAQKNADRLNRQQSQRKSRNENDPESGDD